MRLNKKPIFSLCLIVLTALTLVLPSAWALFGINPDPEESWDGPVLYHQNLNGPLYIILVEKALQTLHLYKFDGDYTLIKSYSCVTGENPGKKTRENDRKTPEGIYFNDRTFRDTKITLFGDRAFGLNYPDAFDKLENNGGSGIFIHGSNKAVTPYSTNGCLVMENHDIAELDQYIQAHRTPIIVGERLPYNLKKPKKNWSEVVPLLKKAMTPQELAKPAPEYNDLIVLGFSDRAVVAADITQKSGPKAGQSRLYLSRASDDFLLMVRREWAESKTKMAKVDLTDIKTEPQPTPKTKPAEKENTQLAAATPIEPPEEVPIKKRVKPVEIPKSKDISQIESDIESWRRAWQSKKLETYIGYYHPGFENRGRNRNIWKAYKARLNRKYKTIKIDIHNLSITVNGSRAKAYFKQDYTSDLYESTGYKMLDMRKTGGRWKIFRENSYPSRPASWPS